MYAYANTKFIVHGPGVISLDRAYGQAHSFVPVVYDKKSKKQADLLRYFNNAQKIFTGRIQKLTAFDYRVTVDEEKELHFMLDALLSAKQLLRDGKKK